MIFRKKMTKCNHPAKSHIGDGNYICMMCGEHLFFNYKKQLRERKKEKGECYDCKEDAFPGYVQCKIHRKLSALRESRYRKRHRNRLRLRSQNAKLRLKAQNRCVSCGIPLREIVDSGCVTCSNCRTTLNCARSVYENLPKINAIEL